METKINANQIKLYQLFSVKDILLSHGFELEKECNLGDTIFGLIDHPEYRDNEDILFDAFESTEKREALLNTIKNNAFDDKQMVEDKRRLYSNTFEWYVGELMVRKFSAFSHSFGAKVKNIIRNSDDEYSGDFDALVVQRNLNLVYFECKTGGYNSKDIRNALERGVSLHTEFVVFIIDNRIKENKLISCLKNIQYSLYIGNPQLGKVRIKEGNAYIYKWHNLYFITALEDLEIQIQTILRINDANKMALNGYMDMSNERMERLGYETIVIKEYEFIENEKYCDCISQ
ncbi:MAG: hypothetical protein WCR42_00450 [bacterium]